MANYLRDNDNKRYFIVKHDLVFDDKEDIFGGIRIITDSDILFDNEFLMVCPYVDEITREFGFSADSFMDIEYAVYVYMNEYIHDQVRATYMKTDFSKENRTADCPEFVFRTFDEASKVFEENGYDRDHYSILEANIARLIQEYAFLYDEEEKTRQILVFHDCSIKYGFKPGVVIKAYNEIMNNTAVKINCYSGFQEAKVNETSMEAQIKYLKKHYHRFDYIYIENINSEAGKMLRLQIEEISSDKDYSHGIINYILEEVEEV